MHPFLYKIEICNQQKKNGGAGFELTPSERVLTMMSCLVLEVRSKDQSLTLSTQKRREEIGIHLNYLLH